MLKVLTILGSPREKSNAHLLASQIVKGITSTQGDVEVETISLRKMKIQPCIACDGCHRKAGCVVKDEMQELYPKFDQADLVIVASPIYFNSLSAQLKGMIDRCQAIWASKYVLKTPLIDRNKRRVGVFVAAAGNPDEFAEFEPSVRIMDLFFKSINTTYLDNLFVTNTDQAPVADRPDLLEQAEQLGVKMVAEFEAKPGE